MRRTYMAWADTGTDYIDFEFISEHRANSKANKEDALREYKSRHGYRSNIKVLRTSLWKE